MSFNVEDLARIRAAVAPMHAEARVSSAQTSQQVAGRTVTLLEQKGDWWLVRGVDNYTGWIHYGYLEAANGNERAWSLSTGAVVRGTDGLIRALPVNAKFDPACEVVSGKWAKAEQLADRFPLTSRAVMHSAAELFAGASYQWGGVTEWGCDCSGLVQAVFALHGKVLPRDAHQQAECGQIIPIADITAASSLAVLDEADLLFFSDREDRRITHVGLMLTGARMLHSALGRGGVNTENLRAEDEYVGRLRKNFVKAMRVLF